MNPKVQIADDDSYDMPCAEAMLAGTLALMTGHAQSHCAQHRALMAKKVMSNLYFLAQHPALHANFRIVMGRMHQHWNALVEGVPTAALAVAATGPRATVSQSLH